MSARSLTLSFVGICAAASGFAQTEHRLMTELDAVYPHSLPGPVTSTPDGRSMFVAESGVLAIMNPNAQSGSVTGQQDPLKREVISSHGVRAVDLLLDPAADFDEDPDGPEALLYVAGGRLGLWAMQADPTGSAPLLATRIDAGEINGAESLSWCNNLGLMEHDEKLYLAALFAHKHCSRLRLYDLDAVRAKADPTTGNYAETGTELAAAADVGVGGNCTFMTPRNESFGYGLAVDGNVIYVALGSYGVQRVAFHPVTIGSFQVSDGPWFGDGSFYAENVRESYGNYHSTDDRDDPPHVMDVAVQRDGSGAYLWLAADNLGILRFDLTEAWGTQMPIDHQEGRWPTDGNLREIQLVRRNTDQTDEGGEPHTLTVRNFAHRLSIAETERGLVLAVAVSSRPQIFADSILDEGRVLGHLGTGYQGTNFFLGLILEEEEPQGEFLGGTGGPHDYTILYDLSSLDPVEPGPTVYGDHQHAKFVRHGGRDVHLPPVQPEEALVAFGVSWLNKSGALSTDSAHLSFRAIWDWPADTTESLGAPNDDPEGFLARERAYRAGRAGYEITLSAGEEEHLHTGSNDAGFPIDGYLACCPGEFVRYYDPPETDPDAGADTRGTYGIIFNPHSVWDAPLVSGKKRDFVFGTGKKTPSAIPRWMLVHVDPGKDLCDPLSQDFREPDREKTIYVSDRLDAFGSYGRGFYNTSSSVLDAFDQHCRDQDPNNSLLVFVCRCATPAGLLVLNRATLESTILDGGTSDGHIVLENEANVYFRELLTHPEFANAYNDTSPPTGLLTTHGLQGRVITFAPQLTQIPPPTDPADGTRWVLAVPSGAVQFPQTVANQVDTGHRPDQIYLDYYDHAMVRVFDVHDYATVIDDEETVPAYTLLGPRSQSAAFRLETLNWKDESYVFVGDFGGSVLVWRVTDLFDETPGAVIEPDSTEYGPNVYFEEWLAPKSVSDDIRNNVWHIAVVNEVWHDGTDLRDEVYVYVMVGRYGLVILRFDPDAQYGQRLERVGYLRIPSGMGGMRVRDEGGGQGTLVINESTHGLRSFRYPN